MVAVGFSVVAFVGGSVAGYWIRPHVEAAKAKIQAWAKGVKDAQAQL